MDQIRHEIETRFNISIAKSTVRKSRNVANSNHLAPATSRSSQIVTVREHLLKESYTVKAVRFEPERANTMENKRKRKMYVER